MPGSSAHEVKVKLTILNLKGKDLRVVRFKGEEGVSMQFLFNLLLACDDANLSLDDVVGSTAWLTISTKEGDRYVHGMISRLEQQDTDANRHYTFYQATLVPTAWRLRLRKDCRIFQDQTVKEIVAKILKDEGIKFKIHGKDKLNDRKYCVQFRESDWAFINRLLEEEGFYYYFEHRLKQKEEDVLEPARGSLPPRSTSCTSAPTSSTTRKSRARTRSRSTAPPVGWRPRNTYTASSMGRPCGRAR